MRSKGVPKGEKIPVITSDQNSDEVKKTLELLETYGKVYFTVLEDEDIPRYDDDPDSNSYHSKDSVFSDGNVM